jgi:hypothetical protein
LFKHSQGNHVFPLLAAHGALWPRDYFRLGIRIGSLLAWRYAAAPRMRQEMMASLQAFANAFRDKNFADMSERIERGFQPFDAGAFVDWGQVEHAVRTYHVMPDAFLRNSIGCFVEMRNALLSASPDSPVAA